MNEEEKKAIVARISAEYGIKVDRNDPSLMIVDMCAQVLDKRLQQLDARQLGAASSGAELAGALIRGMVTEVSPKLQAVVRSQVDAALALVMRPHAWSHPVVTGIGGALAGVIVGSVLHRLA